MRPVCNLSHSIQIGEKLKLKTRDRIWETGYVVATISSCSLNKCPAYGSCTMRQQIHFEGYPDTPYCIKNNWLREGEKVCDQ